MVEIIEIVNREASQNTFDPIIRKLDRQIGQRSRLVYKDGRIVEEIITTSNTEGDWMKTGMRSMVSNTNTQPVENSQDVKQSRITVVAEKLNDITNFVKERRKRLIEQKFESLELLLDKLSQQRMTSTFSKLAYELSHQDASKLARKTVKPNYATTMRFMKSNMSAAIAKTESLILHYVQQQAFDDIRLSVTLHKMAAIKREIVLNGCFERLKINVENVKAAKNAEKTTMFMIKLDAFSLLLKYSAFYSMLN